MNFTLIRHLVGRTLRWKRLIGMSLLALAAFIYLPRMGGTYGTLSQAIWATLEVASLAWGCTQWVHRYYIGGATLALLISHAPTGR